MDETNLDTVLDNLDAIDADLREVIAILRARALDGAGDLEVTS